MAPLKPVKLDAVDKRLQQMFGCASKACALLKDRAAIPESLESEIDTIVKRSLPFPSSTALAGKSSALDAVGSQLWNAATNSSRDADNEPNDPASQQRHTRLVALLRVFGYLLVDASQQTSTRRTKDLDRRTRTFKIALKACRFCLDAGEAELALKVLERLSEYASSAEEDSPIVRVASTAQVDRVDHQLLLKQLVTEYYLLRMAHARMTGRFDLADHFYNKLNLRELAASTALAEKAADLSHEAAKALVGDRLLDLAITWCDRAVSALDRCEVEDLSHDAPELRLAITATYVEAHLATGHSESRERATTLLGRLEAAYGMGNRIAVTIMRFQILTAERPVDLGQVDAVVARMIRQAVLTERSFKTILQTIHKLRRVSAQSALAALTQLIHIRLLSNIMPDDKGNSQSVEQLEKATVAYVLFATTAVHLPQQDALVGIRSVLDDVSHQTNRILSAKATHSAQTLIWKKAGALSGDYVDDWCRILRHAAFDNAGQMNKGRIGRKAITAALNRNDPKAARQAFFEMPEATRNENITRYLMFKVALRDDDYDLAAECLSAVTKHSEKDPTYLYACVLEAQQSNMRHIAVAALQALSEQLPQGVHLPSLLRCTARLLIGELEAGSRSVNDMMEEVVLLFERAAKNTPVLRQANDAQWRSEVQWWSKNAYNLAIRWCAEIHPNHLVRILDVCVHFLDCWPTDDGPMHQDDLWQKRMLCHFLSGSALMVLGRDDEQDASNSLDCYSRARTHIAAYVKCYTRWEALVSNERTTEEQRRDLLARKFELLKFELECILKLKQWDQLDEAVQGFLTFEGANRWDSLADLLVVIHDHARAEGVSSSAAGRIPELLQMSINKTWKKDKDIKKMSRWLRLAFSINLNDGGDAFALQIVQQAAGIAQKGHDTENVADLYPVDELSWLATSAFNKGVDCLANSDTEGTESWTVAALELARYADDGGALHKSLTDTKIAATARRPVGHE